MCCVAVMGGSEGRDAGKNKAVEAEGARKKCRGSHGRRCSRSMRRAARRHSGEAWD